MTRRSGRPVLVILAALVALAAAGSVVASPFPGSVVEGVDAWLDRPLPSDAPAGSQIRIGATIWSSRDEGLVTGSSVFFRMDAAGGASAFSEVVATEDWTGHCTATLTVPEGGVGELQIGTPGNACDANGCSRVDAVHAVAGVGPPAGAPLRVLATAVIERPTRVVATDQPVELTIRLVPRAEWEPGTFSYPEELRVTVREPRGPDLDDVPAVAIGEGTYRATIAPGEPGEFAVQVAVDSTGRPASLFATSTLLLAAEVPASATPIPTLPPSVPGDDGGGHRSRSCSRSSSRSRASSDSSWSVAEVARPNAAPSLWARPARPARPRRAILAGTTRQPRQGPHRRTEREEGDP